MRAVAYVIASVAAVIIIFAIVQSPNQDSNLTGENASSNQTSGVDTALASTAVMTGDGELTLDVPQMHCPISCYPRVKELLEASESVEQVELAVQKEEGVIDNRQVIVHYKTGFDVAGAIAKLDKEGFSDSAVAQ